MSGFVEVPMRRECGGPGCTSGVPRGARRDSRRHWIGAALVAVAAGLAVDAAPAGDPDNCLFCHQYRGLSRYDQGDDAVHLFFVRPDYVHDRLGPHARIACTDCHERSEVMVVPHKPVTRVDCTRTCHLSDPGGIERSFSHENVAEMLEASVHTREMLSGLDFQGGPILGPQQSRCLYCHDEPLFRDPTTAIPKLAALGAGAFDRCDTCHTQQIPADIAYYLRHIASRLVPARPTLEMAQVCAVCHSDPQIRAQHELPNSVASFVRSFHGKAALLGDQTTASCVSCHVRRGANVHLMLGPENPQSAVNPIRVADSCRSLECHPGAAVNLGAASVHLDLPDAPRTVEYIIAGAFILLTIFTFGPSMLICVMELFALVIGRHHHGQSHVRRLVDRLQQTPEGRASLIRFTPSQRVQHWILVILFALLAITGFPLKFADQEWAKVTVNLFGGLAVTRLLHHWGGVALMLGFAFHVAYIFREVFRRMRTPRPDGTRPGFVAALTSLPMWVGPADGIKMGRLLGYLLYLRRNPPAFGRFSVKEKFEYLGVFWGTTLLGITGLMLWGAAFFSHYFSGRVFNIALIAHTYEAFLAIIHVGILHIINVMLSPNVFPLSRATLSGRTPEVELAENHDEFVLDAARELGIRPEGPDSVTEEATHD